MAGIIFVGNTEQISVTKNTSQAISTLVDEGSQIVIIDKKFLEKIMGKKVAAEHISYTAKNICDQMGYSRTDCGEFVIIASKASPNKSIELPDGQGIILKFPVTE